MKNDQLICPSVRDAFLNHLQLENTVKQMEQKAAHCGKDVAAAEHLEYAFCCSAPVLTPAMPFGMPCAVVCFIFTTVAIPLRALLWGSIMIPRGAIDRQRCKSTGDLPALFL